MSFSANMPKPNTMVGNLRFTSDMRQFGGLLLVTGLCAIVKPIANVVDLVEPDGGTVTEGITFASLIGSLCVMSIGFLSVFVGYSQLVHDWGNQRLTGALILLNQTSFIPYITDMTMIGKLATQPGGTAFFNNFDPSDVSSTDVKFVGAMGICGVIPHGLAFMGSIAFMAFAMYAYQAGKPQDRSALYYRSRMRFYCVMLLLAGLVQLALGAYLSTNFETGAGGRFQETGGDNARPYVGVAMFIINIPAISVFVGGIQCMNALWGLERSYSYGIKSDLSGGEDWNFQASIYAGWFLQIILQSVVQIGLQGPVPAAAGIVCVTFGLNVMPAFLDYKSRTVPLEINAAQYYGLTMIDMGKKECAPTMQAKRSDESTLVVV